MSTRWWVGVPLAFAIACARASGSSAPPTPVAALGVDTAFGRIEEVGPDPVSWLALVEPGGAQLRMSGGAAQELRAVVGAQVWVRGARDRGAFRVDSFEVRRVHGDPVDDGILVLDSAGVAIHLPSGATRVIPRAPEAMRALAGARVWVSRPVADLTPAYGVIRRP